MVLRYGALITLTGTVLGLSAAWQLSRFLEALVWGVGVADPLTYIATTLILGLTAMVASLVPAWRAARTDPLETLRSG
jgi:ABC-type lipoprotein release transport system permease subunit